MRVVFRLRLGLLSPLGLYCNVGICKNVETQGRFTHYFSDLRNFPCPVQPLSVGSLVDCVSAQTRIAVPYWVIL